MATRRQGREWALQMLFQDDLNPGQDLDMTIRKFWRQQWTCKIDEMRDRNPDVKIESSEESIEERIAPLKIRLFTEALVRGVGEHFQEIDERIFPYLQNWPMHRIGSIERNVLRLAFYEMMFCPDVPRAVVLNEAIDLAKYFSNADAGRFVNGILDKFNKDLPVPDTWTPKKPDGSAAP
ncbi:MAG: transcription antitermination factor NusB [Kiritimatiellaeota bacterium]|nr:transcription antitermination factor NusB [Kiritimatiellota bacterium]